MDNSRKRKAFTVADKVEIIRDLEKGAVNHEVCKKYDLTKSTVSTIWKNREKILKEFEDSNVKVKRKRSCKHSYLDRALFEWFKLQRSLNRPISGPILQAQADKFARENGDADFICSSAYIDRFKKRHNICLGKISGEANSVNVADVKTWINDVWNKV